MAQEPGRACVCARRTFDDDMLPLKDNLPHARIPLVTLALIAASVAGFALPTRHGSLVAMLLDILFLALLAPSVEGRVGHARLFAVSLVGGLLALAVRSLAGEGALPAALPLGAAGATVAVLTAYLMLFPRGRVFTLVVVPFLFTVIEIPAALLLGLWLAAQVSLGAAG